MSTAQLLQLVGIGSLLTFVGSLLAVPWMINRLAADYFIRHWQDLAQRRRCHPLRASCILVVRNGIGLFLLAAGVIMLVLPGQGLLTILLAICVMDFPGKQRLIRRLVDQEKIRKALNWIRRRGGREEFSFPQDSA
ncbi:PGPGW domain-containing protein [Desulfogranum mediterraneum]|uniref:PGPGW domain-containing protein n=1 Tax=Desulfogranum mediterraneum TaxID=160661 RepID=UPI000491520A|nr:PGPGW domain-containing protein [Desulfogranum mediterraneum]